MIDIQVNSFGIDLIIEIEATVDDFDSMKATILSPSGGLTELSAAKEQDTSVKVLLGTVIDEIGIYEIQVIGEKAGFLSYSSVGQIRANKNVKDIL